MVIWKHKFKNKTKMIPLIYKNAVVLLIDMNDQSAKTLK